MKFGNNGQLVLYYKDVLCSCFPLHKDKYTYENYKRSGEYLILETMKRCPGIDIKCQIYTYMKYCAIHLNRVINKQHISTKDHKFFCSSIFALIKLKLLDEEDCTLTFNLRACLKSRKKLHLLNKFEIDMSRNQSSTIQGLRVTQE